MTNALPDAFIAGATYYLLQLLKPPLKALLAGILPADRVWQDNGIRAVGFVVTYGLLVANSAAVGSMTLQAAWALLPVAAGVYGGSLLLYHAQGTPGPATATPTQDGPQRLITVPAGTNVSVTVPPTATPPGQPPATTDSALPPS